MEFIYSKRWCELMFDNRNKNYGAYVLRKREADNLLAAWFIAVSILLSGAGILIWFGQSSGNIFQPPTPPIPPINDYKIYKIELPLLPKTETPKITSDKTTNAFPVVVDNKITDDKKIEIINPVTPVDIKGAIEVISSTGTNGNGTTLPPVEKTEPILVADVMPEFPGGEKAMLKYLQQNIHYPFSLVKDGVAGIVYLSFVVDQNGAVTAIKILKGVKDGEALADEAIRVVSKMPLWKPGIYGGKNVPVIYNLPVNFVLQ